MTETAIRSLRCLDYHATRNAWNIKMGTMPGNGAKLSQWRIRGAECLAENASFDVTGDTLCEALEAAFLAFPIEFLSEAEHP